jgi:hypothetical protein
VGLNSGTIAFANSTTGLVTVLGGAGGIGGTGGAGGARGSAGNIRFAA